METPTLITQIDGHDFTITGEPLAVIEAAELAEAARRREYAAYIMKHVVTAPFVATGVLLAGIGRAVAHNVHEAMENYELQAHDSHYGTHLYDKKQQMLINERTRRLEHKAGLVGVEHCTRHP